MSRSRLLCVCALIVPCAVVCESQARTWTNDEGQTIEASFDRVDGRMAILKQEDETVRAPISRLSEADQDWIKRYKKLLRVRTWGQGEGYRGRYDAVLGDMVHVSLGSAAHKVPFAELTPEDVAVLAAVHTMQEEELPAGLAALLPAEAPPAVGDSAPRDWTSDDGRTITAQYVRTEGDAVVIYRAGREFKVPLAKLSQDDQQWVAAIGAASPGQRAVARQPPPRERQPRASSRDPLDAIGSGGRLDAGSLYDGSLDPTTGELGPNNDMQANAAEMERMMAQVLAEQSKAIAFGVLGTVFKTKSWDEILPERAAEGSKPARSLLAELAPPPVEATTPVEMIDEPEAVAESEPESERPSTLPRINHIEEFLDEDGELDEDRQNTYLEAAFGPITFDEDDITPVSYGQTPVTGIAYCEHCAGGYYYPEGYAKGSACPFCDKPVYQFTTLAEIEEFTAEIEAAFEDWDSSRPWYTRRWFIKLAFFLVIAGLGAAVKLLMGGD